MSEPIQIALISAGSALIGIILGAIISPLTTLLIESRKRHWELEDQRMLRFLQLEERRLNKIETELLRVMTCFNNILLTIANRINLDLNKQKRTQADFVNEIQNLNRELSARQEKIGVIIGSIDNKDLHEKWIEISKKCVEITEIERNYLKSNKVENLSMPGDLQESFEKTISEFLAVVYAYKVRLGKYYELEK